MPWTDDAQVELWVKGVSLGLVPGSFTEPIANAETLLEGRLISFIAPSTVAAWTTLVNTPALVQLWTAKMSAAIYLAENQNYLMSASPPDNPAAVLYADVMAEIKRAEMGEIKILSTTGAIISVTSGPVTNTVYRDVDELPISAGGNKAI